MASPKSSTCRASIIARETSTSFTPHFRPSPTIGTETASTRTTRGIYADDKKRGYVARLRRESAVEKAVDVVVVLRGASVHERRFRVDGL